MKILLLLFFAIGIFSNANSQSTTVSIIAGLIKDAETHQPIEFSTVTLLNAVDSVLVKGALSDSTGYFGFENIAAGNYLIAASSIGLIKNFCSPFQFSGKENLNIGSIELSKSVTSLKGVTVIANKPLFEQKPGMLVVNVQGSIAGAGNSIIDVLRKSPGINVDGDGNISLKGKQGVMVLIDDKPTYLSHEQLNTLLKSTPSTNVFQIEIMSNPPAKFDAEGTAGIINIRMKKNTSLGFNGMVNGSFKNWTYASANGGLTMNYKNKWVNVFGNYTYNNYQNTVTSILNRRFYQGDSLTSALSQKRFSLTPGIQNSFKTGADFFIGKNKTLGFFVNGTLNNENYSVVNDAGIVNPFDEPLSGSSSAIGYQNKFNNLTYDLNYNATLDTFGTSLSANMDYSQYSTSSLENYHTDYSDASGNNFGAPTIWAGNQPSVINIQSAKIDFEYPFKSGIQMEAGLKTSLVTSDNKVEFSDFINNNWVIDSGITNHFKYCENINALYSSLTKEFKKGWGIQIGLRGEQTIVSGHQLVNDSSFKRNYFQLFPTVFVKKDYGKQNSASFSYSRRVDRPDYLDLNPFQFYVDPYTYRRGNPYLNPQFTDAFNITNTYKNFFTVSLDASRTSGLFADVIEQIDSLNLVIQYKDNINTLDNISLTLAAPITITKWWQTSNYASVFLNRTTGNYLGKNFDHSGFTVSLNMDNSFTLPNNFTIELSGNYQSPMAYSIFDLSSTADISAGIKKSFWNNRGNLKINISDIFNTTHSKAIIRFENIDIVVDHRWASRMASASFTYVFGNTKMRGVKHSNGIEDEQGRVKKATG